MLTRLKVSGFKNLQDVDLYLGPFTCIAGGNGAGKSNLFDAIRFLSLLADKPLMEAAVAVRGSAGGSNSVDGLFHRSGDTVGDEISLLVEMIIPPKGEDELGQDAQASMTFLRYELSLRRASPLNESFPTVAAATQLVLTSESMVHINRGQARKHLHFRHTKAWRESVITGRRTSPYISTTPDGIISLHTDAGNGKGGGRPRRVPAQHLPRTMLSSVNSAREHKTLVLAKREMMSWFELQLEPSFLRSTDSFTAPRQISPQGAHLPATLYRLSRGSEVSSAEDIFAQVANRLSELLEDVREIHVDVDERRQLLSIVMTDHDGTSHFADALSDGTLRFLALAVMEVDPRDAGVMCLEEPENGIHPLRIPAMVNLLQDLAVDPNESVDEDNPLRQVIINTHSPSVVACVPDDALLLAAPITPGRSERGLKLRFLTDTWRCEAQPDQPPVARGELLAYLSPFAAVEDEAARHTGRRVHQRKDMQQLLLPLNGALGPRS